MPTNWIKKVLAFLKEAFVVLMISFLTLEFFSFLLSHYQLLPFNELPLAYQKIDSENVVMKSWRTENSSWGSWHRPNTSTRQISKCFDVVYKSNEAGARDDSFLNLSNAKNTYILIGDSFAEGIGVNFKDTAQAIIEEKTGVNVLNFGSAGNFGPVQYSILYSQLAKKYPHNGLIIFFLPDNDFTDNDPEFWKEKASEIKRWRPYYRENTDGGFSTFIPENAVKKEVEASPTKVQIKIKIENYFWSYNVYKTLKFILLKNSYQSIQMKSGYFDAPIDEQKAAVFFIDKIISETNAKNIILVAIPRKQDFIRIAQGADKNKTYWHSAFATSAARLGKPVTFIDLADHAKPEQADDLFLQCDGHWSAKGNRLSAEIISKNITHSN
jgi:hypothetical protein